MKTLGRLPAWTVIVATLALVAGCTKDAATLTELQRVRSGMLDVVLLSSHDALRHGQAEPFVIEFRSGDGATLVDVGTVRASASMSMAGTPMLGSIDVKRTDVPGRYAATAEITMAGTWRVKIEWDGAGKGSVTFPGTVQ
jgi:hypothetical protein